MPSRRLPAVILAILLAAATLAHAADEPQPQPLWPGGAPGALGTTADDIPTLTVWLPKPEAACGAAIVICPGGGYGHLATDHEGRQIAQWLNSFGVVGAVLEYRHRGRGYGHPAPLQDVQRAIRTVRAGAERWRLDPKRVGVLGFSAGGHLASSAAVHFDGGNPDANDPAERVSCRPDLAVLCYPVIAFDEPYTHRGSQRNLLGDDASPELIAHMSTEKQVSAETPPTFLWTTDEDRGVPAENSVQFYLALRKYKVPAELHIFRQGRHGLGLARDVPGTCQWPDLCRHWMDGLGFLKKHAS